MATTITMPQLGETVTEGTVAQWLKKPGDSIEKYEAFVEVSTDKVNAEVPRFCLSARLTCKMPFSLRSKLTYYG